jgi:uncharacterized protein YdhG (YjbR/CyaY superfamily)
MRYSFAREVILEIRTMPRTAPTNIDEYFEGLSTETQAILAKVRQTIQTAAPMAVEMISYNMPAFTLNGIVVYFAAFKNHLGLYPPVHGDAVLEKAISKYAGPKGNLRFPLDEPIPYSLIRRIVKLRVRQNLEKAKQKSALRPRTIRANRDSRAIVRR